MQCLQAVERALSCSHRAEGLAACRLLAMLFKVRAPARACQVAARVGNWRCDSWHAGCRCSQSLQPALQLRARLLLLPCSLGQQDSCRHGHGLGVAYQRRQARPRHLRLPCSSAHALLPASHLSREHTRHARACSQGLVRPMAQPSHMQAMPVTEVHAAYTKGTSAWPALRHPAYAANEHVCVADFENQIGSHASPSGTGVSLGNASAPGLQSA